MGYEQILHYNYYYVFQAASFIDDSAKRKKILVTQRSENLRINLCKPNGISHHYQLEQSISVLRDGWWYYSFLFKF